MAKVGSPMLMQAVALITDDNNDMEPMEKSNLPEFKLIDKAKVVSITDAADRKSTSQLPLPANIPTPLHRINISKSVPPGIITIPNILFQLLILFAFILFTFIISAIPVVLQPECIIISTSLPVFHQSYTY